MNVHGPHTSRGGAVAAGSGAAAVGFGVPELRVVRTALATELAAVRGAVSEWGRQVRLPAEVLVDLLLAVGEATANVVDHAYRGAAPGPMEVAVRLVRRRGGPVVAARITDRGRWRPASADQDRGRGLPMIRALAAHLDVAATGTGTEVCLELTTEN